MKLNLKRIRLGEALLEQGAISREQLEQALGTQRTSGRLLGEILVESGMVTSANLVRGLARAMGVKGCVIRHGLIDPTTFSLLGQEECARLQALPMFKVRNTLTVAMTEPQSLPTIDRLKELTGCEIRPVFALEPNINEFLKKYASGKVDVNAFLTSLAEQDVSVVERESIDDGPSTDLDRLVDGSPIINLVNIAFLQAVKQGASDIHIEPDKKGTRIRYRVDGVMREFMKPPQGMHNAVVSRVKVIGKMDIAEKRLPQEGRVRIVAEGRDIDLRISSMPTLLGEKIVVRILDKRNLSVRLEDLGFRIEAMLKFREILERPHGLVLVTGPTGSGKTTTLYSALDLLRNSEVNIVTVEDPVEYQLDLVNQVQVQEAIGMSFARALRSILRQDPDIIMIGEIRDQETARVGIQAALTGHLVLATLHTNDAAGAVARLSDMGIENYLMSSCMNGVVAQRLARMICSRCATRYYPTEQVLKDADLLDHVGRSFQHGQGCRECHDSGFAGRVGVYEVMEVIPEVRRMIHSGRPGHEIREVLRKHDHKSLREEGVLLAIEGRSTLEEILRVTHNDDEDSNIAIAAAAAHAKEAA